MFENLRVGVAGHVKISDANTGEVLVDKPNMIHYENLSEALAKSLANMDGSYAYTMAFGNGGTQVSNTGVITYNTPNYRDANADLYNATYSKIIADTSPANLDPTRNKMQVFHVAGKAYTDILISCYLDYGEPEGQQAFDNSADYNGEYVFDEMGIKSAGGSGGKLLTHVIFHPVQKSLNRVIQVDYTIRIQTLTSLSSQ
jgi:hypothetical protein